MKKVILILIMLLAILFFGSSVLLPEETPTLEEPETEIVDRVQYYNEHPEILEEKFRPIREAEALAIVVDNTAPGCDDICKEAIMQCILNRTHTRGFPDTIEKVCYMKNQFYGVKKTSEYTKESFQFAKEFLGKQENIYIAKINTNMVYFDVNSSGISFKEKLNSEEDIFIPYRSVL